MGHDRHQLLISRGYRWHVLHISHLDEEMISTSSELDNINIWLSLGVEESLEKASGSQAQMLEHMGES